MAIFALWSAPRARSTAFFPSMAERGDLTVLHEPFSNLPFNPRALTWEPTEQPAWRRSARTEKTGRERLWR